jgi:hypothetical protein
MGLDAASVQFLCAAKSLGVDFTDTATIGRQAFAPGDRALRQVFSTMGFGQDAEEFLRENRFGEKFFSLLGAKTIVSIDCSSYESASIIHDMNFPISDDLRGRFSEVHDGGTIEHVFNVCQALKNCMEMVRLGGHFTQVNEANNHMGHGFWQLSPELVFRAFSAENGYEIRAVLLHESVPQGRWFVVSDPEAVHSRVELCNSRPVYILTVAKRVRITEIFAVPPQQSDYVALWDLHRSPTAQLPGGPSGSRRHTGAPGWRRYIPGPVKSLKRAFQRVSRLDGVHRGFNRPYYRRISERALLRGELN